MHSLNYLITPPPSLLLLPVVVVVVVSLPKNYLKGSKKVLYQLH